MSNRNDPNVEQEMRQLEAAWDREDTARDEANKVAARAAMETPEPRNFARPLESDTLWEHDHEMRGQLTTEAALLKFIMAGNATVTIRSKKSVQRLTYRFSRPDPDPNSGSRVRPIWASLLNGPDNDSNFQFIGSIWPNAGAWTFSQSAKSKISLDAPSAKLLMWMVRMLNVSPNRLFEQAEVWHEGRCGRCNRKLTVPESISSGFGPECIQLI